MPIPESRPGSSRRHNFVRQIVYVLAGLCGTLFLVLLSLYHDATDQRWLAWTALAALLVTGAIALRLLRTARDDHPLDVDDIPNPIFIKDLESCYLNVNKALVQTVGYSKDEMIGKSPDAFFTPAEAQSHRIADQEILRHGGTHEYESTIQLRSGDRRTFLFTKAALYRDAKVVGIIGSYTDITKQRLVEQQLADSERAYRTMVELANEGIWNIDSAGNTTYVNSKMAGMLGYTVEEFIGRSMFDFMDQAAVAEAHVNMARRSQGLDEVHDFRFRHKDGSNRWFIIGTKAMTSADGTFGGALGMLTDITDRKRAEAALIETQQGLEEKVLLRTAALENVNRKLSQQQRAIDASSHCIMIAAVVGNDLIIDYVNPACEKFTGHSVTDAMGRAWEDIFRFEHGSPEASKIRTAIATGVDDDAILEITYPDGTRGWCHLHVSAVCDSAANPTHFVFIGYDITSLRQYEERLEHLTNFDTLTGLPNSGTLHGQLAGAAELADKFGNRLHVAVFDLDRFKVLSDKVGESGRDLILREVAARLSSLKEPADMVARMVADHFAVLMPRTADDRPDLLRHIARMQHLIAEPIEIAGQTLRLSASVGLATYPDDDLLPDSMIERAHIALHNAKEQGRGGIARYAPSMGEDLMARLEIELALNKAVNARGHEFFLQFQPQIDMLSGRVIGFEALMRWDCPGLGRISPARFIPVLEETGDIIEVGKKILHDACQQAQQFNLVASVPMHVSVNLSAKQFADPGLVDCVKEAMRSTRLHPECLILELTESALVQDVESAIVTMRALRELGIGLSIDDFGTGYSSLAYLKRFPLTELKIDQSFVRDIASDPEDALIVTSVIHLAKSLKLSVVAEGVETREQLLFLKSQGCNIAQGYLFSRPLDAAAVIVT